MLHAGESAGCYFFIGSNNNGKHLDYVIIIQVRSMKKRWCAAQP